MFSKQSTPTFPKLNILDSFHVTRPGIIQQHIDAINKQLNQIQTTARQREKKWFEAIGGCSLCGGRGWVVVWDTLDSLSGCYAQYGSCDNPACTPETRKETGLNKSYCSKYDLNKGLSVKPELTTKEERTVENLERCREDLVMFLNDNYYKTFPIKGDFCLVVRGRKVTPGAYGRVFWLGHTRYGIQKVGLKDDKNNITWVEPSNVLIIPTEMVDPDILQKIDILDEQYQQQQAS